MVIETAIPTGFGYAQMIGKHRRLGIRRISRLTVRKILEEDGIELAPNRTPDHPGTFEPDMPQRCAALWPLKGFQKWTCWPTATWRYAR